MTVLLSASAGSLQGAACVPGDKSISHRALMIAAMAVGESTLHGLLEGEDIRRTAAALAALGVDIVNTDGRAVWRVHGVGAGGLSQPVGVLEMGNSGTGTRLLMGLLATHSFTSFLSGDDSLAERPMDRIAEPLRRMGAAITARPGWRLPLTITGAENPIPIAYRLPVPSAQVKSAVLLAGLNTPGETRVIEALPTRDHTERMLRHFGVEVITAEAEDGGLSVALTGESEIGACEVHIPADPSSAAFPAVAATILPDCEITLEGVGVNPLRMGLYDTLREMGADITIGEPREESGEPIADITVRSAALKGVDVPEERAPIMIDEYPVLAVAAAFAEGTTRLKGLGELRLKESDRLRALAEGLAACGIGTDESGDTLTITGCGNSASGPKGGGPKGGAVIDAGLDHRIAMSFLVLGMATAEPVQVTGGETIATSFPGFVTLMNGLGAAISEVDTAA